jgi:DNA-binding response OmpR family regulator
MDKKHILVIEDDPSVCTLLFSCLTNEGYRVTAVQTGEDGLGQIEESAPSLVVLDLNLPGMNGLDVCRTMRRDPWMSRIPVLMLTGKTEEEDVITGLEVGADDYMAKPFSPKLLITRVKVLLRRSRNSLAGPTKPGQGQKADEVPSLLIKTLGYCDLRLANRNLPWGISFSPAQRQLLAMLIAAPSSRIPQEEVQLSFWPDSSSSRGRSSFDSLLSRVRRTLDEGLAPFDSKQYLVVRRGILCLENCQIDAKEFERLVRKGLQQASTHNFWQAEMAFSSAFSLWQGTFLPADFGSDAAVNYQDELQQLYLEASDVFARILAESGRYQEAVKLLRSAQRYNPTDDEVVRLLYQLCLVQEHPRHARQVLQSYRETLEQEMFSRDEIEAILAEMPSAPPAGSWLVDG